MNINKNILKNQKMTTNENISIFYKNSHLEYLLNALENENR